MKTNYASKLLYTYRDSNVKWNYGENIMALGI